jgi:hypothetical protein
MFPALAGTRTDSDVWAPRYQHPLYPAPPHHHHPPHPHNDHYQQQGSYNLQQPASGLDYQRMKKLRALKKREYRQQIKQDPVKDRIYKQRQRMYYKRYVEKKRIGSAIRDIFSGNGGQV